MPQKIRELIKALEKAGFKFRGGKGTCVWDTETQKPIELNKVLTGVKGNAYQMEVKIGADKKTRVECRLICLRVKDEVANKRCVKRNLIFLQFL